MKGQELNKTAKNAGHKTKMKLSVGDRIFNLVNAVIMIIICLVIVYPIYYVIIASITDPVIVNSGRPLFYPVKLYLNGYKTTLSYTPSVDRLRKHHFLYRCGNTGFPVRHHSGRIRPLQKGSSRKTGADIPFYLHHVFQRRYHPPVPDNQKPGNLQFHMGHGTAGGSLRL